MLFGNIVFIKKTGGDGSKYPVTEKNIKIGRSEDCLIRIHNPQVALEHCQLIVDDNGQAKLRYLSKVAILNGKRINQEDVTLCHGDIFKLGERLARWEYLPSSKYYRQPLSPTGRLVAVVMPQQRSIEEKGTPGTSSSVISVSRSTSLGGERRYSERTISENGSVKKVARISSVTKNQKAMSNVAKFMSGRHSLQASKILFGSKVKQRKSTPGVLSSKSPKPEVVDSARKPTMASWKVNLVSPPSSGRATQRKSTPIKKPLPMKSADKIMQSGRKSTIKSLDLKTIVESPPKEYEEKEISFRSTRSTSRSPPNKKNVNLELEALALPSTPGRKSISKSERLFNSEKKLTKRSSLKSSKGLKRSSLVLKPLDKTPVKGVVKKLYENFSKSALSHDKSQENVKSVRNFMTKVLDSNTVVEKSPVNLVETPSKGQRISNKTSPVTSSVKNTPTPKSVRKSRKSSKATSSPAVNTTVSREEKITPIGRRSPASRKSSTPSKRLSSSASSVKKTPSARKSLADIKEKSSPRGVRRKLSPSISSAERAAKKLKTSSPTKPDKNKKAALLVLGKANRKQLLSQNLKVLLKQKIVKKAIKQSTQPSIRKDDVAVKTSVKNVKKKSKKKAVKRKKVTAKKSPSNKRKSPPKSPRIVKESEAQKQSTPLLSISSKIQTPKEGRKVSGRKSISTISVTQTSPSKTKVLNIDSSFSSKSPSKQGKKSESSTPSFSLSDQSTSEFIQDGENSVSVSANYLFNSHRRASKRLSSKNDVSRPDFTELSPTALGLIPKNIEVFKSPKEGKRRSISLATPKNFRVTGIVKSASTSKVGNRKMVRFSSKDISFGSGLLTPNTTRGTDFDFESIQTPNITMDRFVSPLVTESFESFSESKVSGKLSTFPGGEMQRKRGSSTTIVKSPRSEPKRTKCVRKLLQSPQPKHELSRPALLRQDSKKTKTQRSPKNDLTDLTGVQELLKTPQTQKTVKSQAGKSVNQDLSIIEDVRKLFVMPKTQRSPKNDLSDVRGVSRLLRTPKTVKSPKNDLTDVKGVKKLLKTPKVQKSPKNDLTDVRGVKKLLKTPKVQKSPKNDLTDVRGVKKLLKTPKVQKSPKNDLTDVRGVRNLLKTPREAKSPKNDLTDVAGVKRLLRTPQTQRSPTNDLTDLLGVRQLFKSPRTVKSPRNELSDLRGVRQLLASPKAQKSPKNDLRDVTGVRRLMTTPRVQKSPRNDLMNVSSIAHLFESPLAQTTSLTDVEEMVKKSSERSFRSSYSDGTEVKQVLIGNNVSDLSEDSNRTRNSYPKSRIRSFKSIRGRRTIYSSPKSPKNDLSDVEGVKELFSSYQSTSGLSLGLSDLCEFFDIPNSEIEALKRQGVREGSRRTVKEEVEERVVKVQKPVARKTTKETTHFIEETIPRATRSRRGVDNEKTSEIKNEESEVVASTRAKGGKSVKRKAVTVVETSAPKKKASRVEVSRVVVKNQRSTRSEKSKPEDIVQSSEEEPEVKRSRTNKVSSATSVASPPKLRRRLATTEAKTTKTAAKGSSKTITTKRKVAVKTKSPKGKRSTTEVSVDRDEDSTNEKAKKTSRKVATSKVQTKTTKTVSKASAKSTSKVQKGRSQIKSTKEKRSESTDKVSPKNTRSAKATTSTRGKKTQVQSKTTKKRTVVKSTSVRKNVSPTVKKSKARK